MNLCTNSTPAKTCMEMVLRLYMLRCKHSEIKLCQPLWEKVFFWMVVVVIVIVTTILTIVLMIGLRARCR